MSAPYISEIRIFSFGFPPRGWALCNGQLLSIASNQALFSLLGTTYGGDGRTTFALPNLQGNVPLHMGNSSGGNFVQGQTGGEVSVTLTTNQLPQHTHPVNANSTSDAPTPSKSTVPGGGGISTYASTPNTNMNPGIVGSAGSGQPHSNMQPYLALNFCISLQGIFPSRS